MCMLNLFCLHLISPIFPLILFNFLIFYLMLFDILISIFFCLSFVFHGAYFLSFKSWFHLFLSLLSWVLSVHFSSPSIVSSFFPQALASLLCPLTFWRLLPYCIFLKFMVKYLCQNFHLPYDDIYRLFICHLFFLFPSSSFLLAFL